MSFYDPTLNRAANPAYGYGGRLRRNVPGGGSFEFRRKGQEWVYLGETFSLWADPAIDATWVRKIQAVDPNLIPIWVTVAFQAPTGGVEKFTRHGLAWALSDPPVRDPQLRSVAMPSSKLPWSVPRRPTSICTLFRDPNDPDLVPGLPVKPYVTFCRNVYEEVKNGIDNLRPALRAEEDVARWKRDKAYADQKMFEKEHAESDYRWDHDNRGQDWYARLRDMPSRELDEAMAISSTPPTSNPSVFVKGE